VEVENYNVTLNKMHILVYGEKVVVNKYETTPEVAEIEVLNLIRELLINSQVISIKSNIDITKNFKTMKLHIQTNKTMINLLLEDINKLHRVLSFAYKLIAGYSTVSQLSDTDFMLGEELCVSNYENEVCILPCE
jgi:hypothetical protein